MRSGKPQVSDNKTTVIEPDGTRVFYNNDLIVGYAQDMCVGTEQWLAMACSGKADVYTNLEDAAEMCHEEWSKLK